MTASERLCGGTPLSASFYQVEDETVQQQKQQPQHSPWEAVRDQLEVLLTQEEAHYRVKPSGATPAPKQWLHEQQQERAASSPQSSFDALESLPPFTFSDGGDLDLCRRKMCEWAFNVVDYFDYSRDLVSTSLSHVDRYVAHLLESGQEVSKRRFQSVSVTALYLTLKMQGTSSAPTRSPHDARFGAVKRRHLNIRTFVELSRGILSVEALEEEERRMLDGLGYLVNPPTPVVFVEYLVPLLLSAPGSSSSASSPQVDERTLHYVYELSRYYTELAVFERDLSVRHRASCVAFASILCAMSAVDGAAFPTELRRSFASDALGRTPLRLGRSEVEDAWNLLAGLCPLEALDWPGMDATDQGSKSPRQQQPEMVEEDAISHESPTCVTGFMS
eukprot:CAMPEP_0113594080 /NCGR_PEP_ID=MMETSP0015_2-20120614/38857_1 /TAXON_ID=2838 /ORGANISM="Odontella" /LENGTH=389 /DNA_ID=CAMNT_0000500995 /DNA_START=466 /DNA_END=1635 /DNA_ORIENTATION=+ /assembly_acc=CAM_ASM_000160